MTNVNPKRPCAHFLACNDLGVPNEIKQGCVNIMAYCGSERQDCAHAHSFTPFGTYVKEQCVNIL